MPSQQTEPHYCINLTLTRNFLKWTHSHRLVDGEGAGQDSLWANQPDEQKFRFGGKYGTQFKNLQEVESFIIAFDGLLKRKGVDDKHKHSLFYLIMFLGNDYEQQSIDNNRHNQLLEYARFLLDLIADSSAHIAAMRKNSLYSLVYDEYTKEIFFAKKEVIASMPHEDLLEYLPYPKQADDVVKYLRIRFYDDELYVPEDMVITLQSNKGRKLKSISGAQVSQLELPKNLASETFTYIIGNMLDLHKRYNTSFYQDITKENSTLADFKSLKDKYKKHGISNTVSLAKVGVLVGDYLTKHNIYTTKRGIAGFLFEYFALFKAIGTKKPIELPDDYSELIPFYIKNHINSETIRNMMKDVGDI
jgi:hypothetical protein